MASNRLLRTLHPFFIGLAGVVCLLLLSLYARSRTVHVVDITFAQDGDVCTIRCRVVNPFHYEVRAVLEASVTSGSGNTKIGKVQTIAEKTIVVDVPANGSEICELALECPSTATMLRAQVLVQRIERTN